MYRKENNMYRKENNMHKENNMQRLLTISVLAIAFVVVAMPVEAEVLWTENWEQPAWEGGDDMIDQSGWSRASGKVGRPKIAESADGLVGQVATMANMSGKIGEFSNFTNPAGLSGGVPELPSGGELNLSFRWLINPSGGEGRTGSAVVGFMSGVNQGVSIQNNGTKVRFTDMNDNDHYFDLPDNTGAEQIIDFELFATPDSHGWRMNGVTRQTINSAVTYGNIDSIAWGCGRDAGLDCGIMDDMTVSITPEPASLGLLTLGGLALLSRRRRA